MKDKVSGEGIKKFAQCISDNNQEFVKYEYFNRLCDLFFYLPGKAQINKNDSENIYLILSSMARKKAGILYC